MFRIVVISLLASACTVASAPKNFADFGCAPPTGWESVADRADGKILLIGEIHGTAEGPAAFGEYACAAASRGGRTLVGVEYSRDFSDALNAAFAANASRETLLAAAPKLWDSKFQDGRRSEAMMSLLLALGRLKEAGAEIDIVGYDIGEGQITDEMRADMGRYRERILADNIGGAFSGYARAIVLTGNLHAMRAPPVEAFPYPLMGMLLGEAALSLNQTYEDGEAWNCRDGECKAQPLAARAEPPDEGAAQMAWDESLAPQYDGYMHIGVPTASPPAVAAAPDFSPLSRKPESD